MSEDDDARVQREDRRIAEIYRLAADREPPPHLDAAIETEARRAARPMAEEQRPWWMAWRVPFAFAAVAVVSVSLVALMMEEGGEQAALPQQASVPAASRDSPAPASEPAPAPGPQRESGSAPRDFALERQARSAPAEAPPAAPAPESRQTGRADAEPTPIQPSVPSPAPEVAAPDSRLERPQATAESGVARRADKLERPEARPEAAPPVAAPRSAMGAVSGGEPPSERPKPAADSVRQFVSELEGKPAAAWGERITLLRREGRRAEAEALLSEFKKRFPYEPLPPEAGN
ncbi:MAG: hypothetical protein ACXWUU_07685 [Burkholderiales bacterium]